MGAWMRDGVLYAEILHGMKIKAPHLVNHRPVRVTTPYGSDTSAAEIMRYVRNVEAELAQRQRGREYYRRKSQALK